MMRSCLLLAVVMAAGCGGGDDKPIPVSGTVKFADGSAINFERGTVIFEPTGPGKPASGEVDSEGSFTLTTTTPGDGAHPGSYKVVLQLWKSYRDHTLAVPDVYGDASTTPLEATVSSSETDFDFTVNK